MRFIELFAGIGGFRLGLEKAKEFKCIWSNEKDKYACQIYRKNFGDKELHEGDIREITAESIPDHDFLTGGFPCPTYSIAGKRKGFNDPRGIVYFEICRIAKVKKPALLLLENVKGLLNHDNGNTFRIILNSLSELGYDCEWEVLNSKNFGVPQNRERVFIIGHLRGTGGQKIFPIGEGNETHDKKRNERIAKSLTSTCHKGVGNDGTTLIYEGAIMSEKNKKWLEGGKKLSRNFPQGQRVYSDRGIASTIAGNAGGLGGKTGLYLMNTLTEALGTRQGSSKEYIKSVDNIYKAIGLIRRLTPTECERLQGFPDGWTDGISDTQRYKCLGNAVTVNVIEEIGRKLIND